MSLTFFDVIVFFFSLKKWKYVNLDPLLMSVGPETLTTGGTGCLSNITEGLRLKMKIDEVMAILRFGPIFEIVFFFSLKKWKYVNLDPLLMSVGPETLTTGGTDCLSHITAGLRLKMKIDEVMTILR